MKIVIVGSINTDMIVKVPRIPKPGETILGGKFSTAAGGKGANQAVAATRAGGNVTFIARVGNDMFGKQALEDFESNNINAKYIKTDNAEPSGVALIFVDEKGENSIAVASGANARLSHRDVTEAEEVIKSADILLMQLETPMESVKRAAKIAKEAGVKVILNPAPACPLDNTLLSTLYVITPNESEAELLTDISVTDFPSAEKAAFILLDRGVEVAIITMGIKGALIKTRELTKIIPGFKVNAVDSTAAGDVFNGSLVVAMAEGKTLEETVQFANAAAALSVTKLGAQPSAPKRVEIERMLLKQA
jgi:ribokinase|tara:strand:- start:412 stop:1329 length:918 start_codon:yes stop_codon:yes gene_type:complete